MAIEIVRCKQPMEKPLAIEEFAELYSLTIVVNEREHVRPGDHNRFYASFKNTEQKDSCVLIGTFGNGATPEEAIDNYAEEINGKLLVVNAYDKEKRRELWAHLLL